LRAQPAGARAFVFVAGPAMNFVFAILVFAALLFAFGRDITDVRTLSPRVDALTVGYPAQKAGIRPGDLIVSIAGQPVRTFGDMQDLITPRPGQPTEIVVRRGGAEISLTATPGREEAIDATGITRQVGFLGISRGADPHERRIERYNAIEAMGEGAKETWSVVARTGAYVANIFTGKASAEHISGPIGIFTASGQVAKAAVSGPREVSIGERIAAFLYTLVKWAAYLSVAVGIVNLLPIPVLDGGHLLFCAIEAMRRGRPLPPQAQEWALRVGLFALGSLFLFATWNDIRRIFG
jgi:regulator of sigma E protease